MRRWVAPACMGSALGMNYLGHRTGWWPTLCTTTREHLPPLGFIGAWAVLTGVMVKHVLDGYPSPT